MKRRAAAALMALVLVQCILIRVPAASIVPTLTHIPSAHASVTEKVIHVNPPFPIGKSDAYGDVYGDAFVDPDTSFPNAVYGHLRDGQSIPDSAGYRVTLDNVSSILTDSVGDLFFNVTLKSKRVDNKYASITIYIPPEFTGFQEQYQTMNSTNVWTSYTNDYRFISVSKASTRDFFGPGWWIVTIRNSTTLGIPVGSHFVKIFNLKAPSICGLYFFKVFVNGTSIGAKNFPAIIVKGELDPAYVSGTILYGGWDVARFGKPISDPGKIVAEGRTLYGRPVKAQAYFNASANGHYTLYGLALGKYNITVSAAGYPPLTLDQPISVHAGQSLEYFDIYLGLGVNITGTIWSKCGSGPVLWGSVYPSLSFCTRFPSPRPIRIELLDRDGNLLAYREAYTNPVSSNYYFSLNRSIEIDGHVPQNRRDYISGIKQGDYYLKAYVNGYVQMENKIVHVHNNTDLVHVSLDLQASNRFNATIHFKDMPKGRLVSTSRDHVLVLEAYDLYGTLKGKNITCVPAGKDYASLELNGFLGLYWGVGFQDYGLLPSTYMLKAYMSGFIQPTLPQATVSLCNSYTVLSFEIVKGGVINITLTSVDSQTPPKPIEWAFPNHNITLFFYDSAGKELGKKAVQQQWGKTYVSLNYSGSDYYSQARSVFPYYMCLYDEGLETGTYLIRAFTFGYFQPKTLSVQVIAGSISDITLNLLRGVTINVTVNFRTERIFSSITKYQYNDSRIPIRVEVYNFRGELAGANISYVPLSRKAFSLTVVGFSYYYGTFTITWVNYYHTTDGYSQKDYGLPPGTYAIKAFVPGYEQRSKVNATLAPQGNASVTFDMERMARVSGMVRCFNMYSRLLPLSWATIEGYGAKRIETTYSLDGFYEMWLPEGRNIIKVGLMQYETQGTATYLPIASETTLNFELKGSKRP